jgi:hypothetical protein
MRLAKRHRTDHSAATQLPGLSKDARGETYLIAAEWLEWVEFGARGFDYGCHAASSEGDGLRVARMVLRRASAVNIASVSFVT